MSAAQFPQRKRDHADESMRNPVVKGRRGDATKPKAPMHCGREMLAVKTTVADSEAGVGPNAKIWWCAECHYRMPREEAVQS